MSSIIGQGVTLQGFRDENSIHTFIITGTVTAADIGKAVSLNTSQANSVKLAADNDPIFGRLEAYEDRTVEGIKVASVVTRFSLKLPVKSGETVALGDTVCGAGAGEVKTVAVSNDTDTDTDTTDSVPGAETPVSTSTPIKLSSHNHRNRVLEVLSGFVVVYNF